MVSSAKLPPRIVVGDVLLDLEAGVARRGGTRLKLGAQPFQVLRMLVSRPGEVVTREELRVALWPDDVFVDFDHGLNKAVNRLRIVLGDSAEIPQYIETLPKVGYRWIGGASSDLQPSTPLGQEGFSGNGAGEAAAQPAGLPRRWVWLATALVVLAAAALLWKQSSPAPPPVQKPGWVLITAVENRSGEPLLDGTLEYALERELSNSRFVKVVPQQRIQDSLRLLRKPLDAKLDAALGREVCLRDGDIQVLISGRVEKLGSTYVLSVQVVNPARGVTLASFSEEDRADTELASAVRRLSIRVRESLGEEPRQIEESMARLEKVTTPSLAALQLYSQADRLLVRSEGQWNDKSADAMRTDAAGLLEQALAAEPDFASAHSLLSLVLVNAGRREEAEPHLRRAVELASTVSERERLYILGRSYQFGGDWERARQAYESLLALYPDDYWAVNNLAGIYLKEQQIGHITEVMVHRADLRPRDFASNVAAWDWLWRHQQPERARVHYLRAVALVSPEVERDQPASVVSIEAAAFYEAWARRDFGTAAKQADILKNKAGLRTGDLRQATIYSLCEELLILGRLHELDQWADLMNDPGERAFAKATVAEARQDVHATRAAVLEQLRLRTSVGPNTVARLARSGLVPQAQAALSMISGRPYPADADFANGEIALAQGHLPEAVARLSAAVEGFREHNEHYRPIAAVALAKALERQGKTEEAIRVLAREVDSGLTITTNNLYIHLAGLYRRQGRPKEAERLEESVRKSLAWGDPDHPLLALLNSRPPAERSRIASR